VTEFCVDHVLAEAKHAVEQIVLSLATQLPLFGDPAGD